MEWPGYHINSLNKVRPGAKYVDRHRQEYYITSARTFWKIVKFKGGCLPKPLTGMFMTYKGAEDVLVRWLIQTDKGHKARYPGCLGRQ